MGELKQDGFIFVDRLLEDWEIVALGFGTIFETAEDARDAILTDVHPAYWDSYAVRELSAGRLLPELREPDAPYRIGT